MLELRDSNELLYRACGGRNLQMWGEAGLAAQREDEETEKKKMAFAAG